MTKEIELLPCPFCGSEAEIERLGDRRRSTIYQCTSCSCSLETGEEWDHGRDWNARAQQSPPSIEITQHIGWLKQYVEGMNESNWKDMRLRAERQLESLSVALSISRPLHGGK